MVAKKKVLAKKQTTSSTVEEVVEVTVTKTVRKTVKKKLPSVVNIRFVIDRSGSMAKIKDDTIGGFNAFIDEQRDLPGKAKVTYIQFDHEYDTVYRDMDIKEVPKLNSLNYRPRGYTALYDAIGTALSDGMGNSKAREQNILVVLTDGNENASKEYTQRDVSSLMTCAENKGWKVVFLGANIDVAAVARDIGISGWGMVSPDWSREQLDMFMTKNKGPITMNYSATDVGVRSAYTAASCVVRNMRSTLTTEDEDKPAV